VWPSIHEDPGPWTTDRGPRIMGPVSCAPCPFRRAPCPDQSAICNPQSEIPCWSGPRWRRTLTIRWAHSSPHAATGRTDTNPQMPHIVRRLLPRPSLVHRPMASGPRSLVFGPWSRGPWSRRPVVHGPRSLVPWSLVSGRWSLVEGLWSIFLCAFASLRW